MSTRFKRRSIALGMTVFFIDILYIDQPSSILFKTSSLCALD